MNLKKLFNIAPYTKKVKDGFSNNSDYFGDWYGEGQIDFSKVINPDEEGELYLVKIWSGSGYVLDVYLVNANNEYDAIDKVFEWSYENEGANKIIFDYDDASDYAKWVWEDDSELQKDYESFDDFEQDFFDEHYVSNTDYTLFAYSANFFVGKVPQEYLNKEVSDSYDNVSDAEDEKWKRYEDITWDSEDLESSKNAVRMLADLYGVDVVVDLDEDGEFGNLDVFAVLEEEGFVDDDNVSDEEDEIENWEDYRFVFTIYDKDGEIIDQFDGTDVYPELIDTVYDDNMAIELAKEALHNYAESYDGEGDVIEISVDAHEYDMERDDFNGNMREVYSEEYDLH